jgi:type IV pilus assembly protein PilW
MRRAVRPAARCLATVDLRRPRGYSLIELLVAMAVALFLLAGLGAIVGGTRRTSSNQTALTQLQDEERLAMSIFGTAIQSAGYFPLTTSSTSFSNATQFPATTTLGTAAVPLAQGQVIGGVYTSISAPDSLVVRYYSSGSDGIINCNGGSSPSPTTFTNLFFVNTTSNTLQCSIDGNTADAVTIVNNVVNMQIWYGVTTTATLSVDTYMNAAQVQAAADWSKVLSVKMILTFNNPLYSQPGQPKYVYFTRVIDVQAQTG